MNSVSDDKEFKSQLNRAFNTCLRFLGPRARSVKEIKDHLEKKKFTSVTIEKTIEKLLQDRLLDDREFASLFVENREKFRPRSKFALAFELRQKGINDKIIDDVLKDIDEFKSAWYAVRPKLSLWHKFDDEKFKKKILNYLSNRGFSYDVSLSTYNRCRSYIVEKDT